jgi:LacI family transcriptional regulator
MESPREITIYDIARNLNISASTVSRALQDHPDVNKVTKKKVFEMATQMGYRSNLLARGLRRQHTMTIGVMVTELNSGFTTSILSGIEQVANEAGYSIIMTDSSMSAKKEVANARTLFERRVDGIIASPAPDTQNLNHFKPFIEKGIPIILLDWGGQHRESMSVSIDNLTSGYTATSHLIDQGCRRIAHITPNIQQHMYSLRYKGYLNALRDRKILFEKKWLVTSELTEDASTAAAKKIINLKPMPDAVFISDDFAAAICIRAFQDHGLNVPRDIAVVGFNNDIIGRLIKPALTTINYPGKEIGEIAAKNMVYHLKGQNSIDKTSAVTIRSELIIRQSSLRKHPAR